MEDRLIGCLQDIISLLTKEECKKALRIVEEISDMVSCMDYNDWKEYCESEEYQKDIKEYADYLNK